MKVLLFDSKNDQLIVLEEMLTRIGCKVTLAMEENVCITKLINEKFDLFIFDHGIPKLDVSDFVDQIEQIDFCMSVAMMVTLPTKFYENKYGCSGIDFLLFKPFGYDEVLSLLKKAFHFSQKLRKAS